NSYEAHLESDVALDLKGDYAAASEHLKKAPSLAVRDSSGPPEPPLPAMRRNVYSATLGGPLIGSRVGRKSNRNSLARPQSRIFSRSPNRGKVIGIAMTQYLPPCKATRSKGTSCGIP